MSPLTIFFIGPSLFVMLAARYVSARLLGMKGIAFFFGGAIQNPEAAALWRRAAVVLASLLASYLVAGVMFALAALGGGKSVRGTQVEVVPQRPAEAAGMQSGDHVVRVAGQPVQTWDELSAAIAAHAGEPIEIVAERGDETVRLTITPAGERGRGKIGVTPASPEKRESADAGEVMSGLIIRPVQSVLEVLRTTFVVASGTETTVELMGPAGIVREASTATGQVNRTAFFLNFLGLMFAMAWPIVAIAAIVVTPRRARA